MNERCPRDVFWGRRVAPVALAFVVASSAGACGDDGAPSGSAFTLRDSSGVAIAENALPGEEVPVARVLSETPHLEIGARDGPEELQFASVVEGFRLPDGRIPAPRVGVLRNIRYGEHRVPAHDIARGARDGAIHTQIS